MRNSPNFCHCIIVTYSLHNEELYHGTNNYYSSIQECYGELSLIFSISLYLSLNVLGCTQNALRLQGGANSMTGRVEICNRGVWGTVCDDFWGTPDAMVACRQLGFSPDGQYRS